MFDQFKQLGDLAKMQKQAKDLQKQLAKEELTVEENGVKVVVSGQPRIRSLSFEEGVSGEQIMKVVNKALDEAQRLMAQKLMGKINF